MATKANKNQDGHSLDVACTFPWGFKGTVKGNMGPRGWCPLQLGQGGSAMDAFPSPHVCANPALALNPRQEKRREEC